MKAAVTVLAMMTVACTTVPPETGGDGDHGGGAHRCNAEGLANLVGQAGSSALGAEALQRSSSRTLRWIRPGDAVTMDYRQDRLNIELDAEGKVARFTCG